MEKDGKQPPKRQRRPRAYREALERLNPRERTFAEESVATGMGEGNSFKSAFGYSDSKQSAALAQKQEVSDAIVRGLKQRVRGYQTQWTHLAEAAKRILDASMTEEGIDWHLRLNAAKTTLEVLNKSNPATIADAAKKEDEASLADLAADILGVEVIDVTPEPPALTE